MLECHDDQPRAVAAVHKLTDCPYAIGHLDIKLLDKITLALSALYRVVASM